MIFLKEQQANRHRYRKLQFQECLNAAFLDAEHGEFLYSAFCGERLTDDSLTPFAFPLTSKIEEDFRASMGKLVQQEKQKHVNDDNDDDDNSSIDESGAIFDGKDCVHFSNVSALFQYMRKSLESSSSSSSSAAIDTAEKKHCCSMCGFVAQNNKEFALHFTTVYGKYFAAFTGTFSALNIFLLIVFQW